MNATTLAIALGLFSAITLATANLAVKLGSDILVGRAVLSTSSALMVAPFALVVPWPDAATLAALGWAIPVHFAYQICLIRALERGDFSLVFPIMRGTAPLLTALAAAVILGERLSAIGWLGLAIATVAVIAFAWPRQGGGWRAHPDAAALGWAGATAIGVALYSVADARGVRIAPTPVTYIVWLFMVDWVLVTITALAVRRGQVMAVVAARWRYGLAAGALSVLSFGSALYAFSLIETAKVAALRETAVVWAAVFGARLLREGSGARRIAAAVMLVAGLILLQFAG